MQRSEMKIEVSQGSLYSLPKKAAIHAPLTRAKARSSWVRHSRPSLDGLDGRCRAIDAGIGLRRRHAPPLKGISLGKIDPCGAKKTRYCSAGPGHADHAGAKFVEHGRRVMRKRRISSVPSIGSRPLINVITRRIIQDETPSMRGARRGSVMFAPGPVLINSRTPIVAAGGSPSGPGRVGRR